MMIFCQEAKSFSQCNVQELYGQLYHPGGPCIHNCRSFQLIKPEQIDRTVKSSQVSTVVGTCQLHSVCNVEKNKIRTRNLSCFCSNCLSTNYDNCINTAFVEKWKTVTLAHGVEETNEIISDEEYSEVISEPSMPREMFFLKIREKK